MGLQNGKKKAAKIWQLPVYYLDVWSGREDLNLRPLAPHASALPDCATPRPYQDSGKSI